MSERSIAPRPSLEQVVAIVDFMEKHRSLALGKLRGLEGRDESKRLWLKLTRIVNNILGPTRPMKSWIKYWADKKSTVRSKVVSGGDPNVLCSNIEKKIWDLFLSKNERCTSKHRLKRKKQRSRSNSVKMEPPIIEEPVLDDDVDLDQNHDDDPALGFDEPALDFEERQMVVMDRLVTVMSEQAAAMTQLALASQVNAQAMERLADASQIQARAVERLVGTFESIGTATNDVRSALLDIDATMKRFYNTTPL